MITLLEPRLKELQSSDFVLLFGTAQSNIETYISKKLRPILNNLFNTELEKDDR